MSKPKVIGQSTNEQIQAWEKEHGVGRIFSIEIKPSPDEVSVGYFRKPNRIHIGRAMSLVIAQKVIEAGETILDDTWLGGDPRIKSIEDKDTEFRVAAAWQLYESTRIFEASIKNVLSSMEK